MKCRVWKVTVGWESDCQPQVDLMIQIMRRKVCHNQASRNGYQQMSTCHESKRQLELQIGGYPSASVRGNRKRKQSAKQGEVYTTSSLPWTPMALVYFEGIPSRLTAGEKCDATDTAIKGLRRG